MIVYGITFTSRETIEKDRLTKSENVPILACETMLPTLLMGLNFLTVIGRVFYECTKNVYDN